jgi:hypothetical protein
MLDTSKNLKYSCTIFEGLHSAKCLHEMHVTGLVQDFNKTTKSQLL